jgi:hypothetical protein
MLRLMICQWVNRLTVQYLPVYYPSQVRAAPYAMPGRLMVTYSSPSLGTAPAF